MKNIFLCLTKANATLKTGGGNSQCYALRSEGALQRVSESETRGVNHAIITQLSRNNHPITLRAIRYVAVLLMVFMVGIGNAWGKTNIVWDFTTNAFIVGTWSNSAGKTNTAQATDGSTQLTYITSGSGDKFQNNQLQTNGKTSFSSNDLSQAYFALPNTLSGAALLKISFGTTAANLKLSDTKTTKNTAGLDTIVSPSASTTYYFDTITYVKGTTYYLVQLGNKSYFTQIAWIPLDTINFDASTNGGTCSTTLKRVANGNQIGTLPTPTKADATFDGWYTTPSGEGTLISTTTIITNNATYFARFSGGGGGGGGSTPSIDLSDGTVNVKSKAGSAFVTATTTLTGSNLTDGTYNVTTSASGLSISPTSFTVSGGSVSQTFTVSYTGSSSGSESISFSDGTTSTSLTANYSTQAVSSDATLSSVTIGGVTATLAGSAGSYTAKIDRSDKGFSMTQDVAFTTSDANATVKLTNASGEVITSVTGHNFGSGNLVLYVLAEDDSTNATYTVSITTYDKYLVYITTSTTPSENIYSTLSTYATAHNYKLSVWNVDNTLSAANMASNYDLVILAEAPGSGKSTAQAVGSAIGNVPVLNFKAFMFGKTNWPSGAGNNLGTGENAIKTATALVPCHTIYNNLSLTGASTTVTFLSSDPTAGSKNGVQAISGVSASGWRSLAKVVKDETTYSALLEYTGTAGANKAIVIPISDNACANISTATQTIIGNAVAYLLDNTALYTINTTKTITGIHVAGFADGNITDNGDGTYALESASGINSTDNAVTVDLSSNCASYSVDYSGLTEGYGDVTITVTAESGAEGTYTLTVTATTPSGYAITKSAVTNGTIAVTDGADAISSADEDDVVYIAATPTTDYVLDAWDVYKTSDSETKVSVTETAGVYTFTMPAYAVTVSASFVADSRAKILYVTSASTENDKLYAALKDDYNVKVVGPTSTETVTSYALVVLHESVTGSNYNATAVAAAKNSAVPVLNTKSYFYNNANTDNQRWNWGTPNAGKKTKGVHVNTGYCNITSHPLFNDLTPDENDSIIILSSINSDNKPIQPIGTFTTGKEGYTLANVPDGCAIHELTPAQRGVASGKYLLISVYNKDLNNLNANGQKLFQNAAAYLIDGSANWTPVVVPTEASIAADPSENYTEGNTITLTASATGTTASTTYTWYKGDDWASASATTPVQAASTSGATYTKANCVEGDAGTYWCNISNGTSCDVQASVTITVSSASTPTHTITYENLKGVDVSAYPTEYTEGIGVASFAPLADITGWHFVEWSPALIGTDADEDVTITAVWTEIFEVTFDLQEHGSAIDAQDVLDGGKVTKPADPSETDWNFGGWYKEAGCTNAWDFANDVVTEATVLYAKWTADPCGSTERKSLSKVVLTAADDGTVSGYNGDEYAGDAVIGGLSSTQAAEVDDSHEGTETGYKLNNGGSAIVFATLKKGTFQEGDKVVVTITKKQDAYKVEEVGQPILDIYYGTSKDDATFLTTIDNVTSAGSYTYRLTAADVTAIGSKKGIGVYRPSSGRTQNPYVYSVEITGCRNWTVMRTVSFDMKDHGSAIADVPVEDGEKISAPAEPEAEGYLFQGWYKETTLENEWDFANDVVEADITLYAKWVADPCSDRQSLSKVVLTAKDNGTVTGYNSKEYAGAAVIAGLDGSEDADIIGDATKERGYKLNNGGSAILFATLAKGNFQEGDKVTVGITKINDTRTVDASTAIMTIYAGSDKDHTMEVTTLTGVSAPGFYTYRLTAADATAINTAGYKSIGLFRASSNGENHHVYSVEITGCRDWSASHDVTFNMHDHGSAIAAQSVYEGGKVTKPAVVEPEGWAFDGWYKEGTYENEWDFDVDVMGTSDIELHAKWESEAGVIKLFDGEGNLNTTNFISAAKTTIEINEVEYPTLVDFGSNRTSLSQAKQADMVMYSATTDATKIKFELYNANGSAKSAYLWLVEEGDAAATAIDVVEVPGNERLTTSYYTFNGTKNRSFYLTSGSKADIKVMQVKVMDNGTAIPQFGKAGYSVDFNKGRIAVASNGTVSFEGASIHSNDEYSVLNNESIKPKTYIQFNNAVANTTVKIKKASSNKYYVTNDLDNKGTEYSTDQEIVLTTTGTWYIGSVNSGSVAALSKIEFIAPKCEAPAFTALANSDICSGDAYVALDGTGSVSDGGSISYKWYADGDAENVLATTATYMPEADGSYYVVALHHVDGYTDNEATSDVVTVTTHEGTAITEGLAHVRKTAGEAATLTVEATGKDLHYAWKECETIDGTYTDVAGAADSKSLEIIVPDGIKYYKVIVSSGCGADQESIAKVEKFVPVAQVVVSTSVSWDLTTCADAMITLTKTSSPKKGEEYLMANIEGVHMNENFHSESLVMSGEYIYRDVTGRPTCAEYMKFETSVPGLVRVHFAGNGSNRCLRITSSDGVQYSSVSTGTGNEITEQFEVAAGEIELMGMNSGHTSDKQYMRFFQIEFYALDVVRNDSWIAPGELGTVCYPNGHIVVGADMYQMAGVDENYKFAFDQVTVTEPGVPYLFEAIGYDPIKFYKTTAAAADEAGTSNGMVGTFVDKILTPAEGENLYYFQGAHFYSVADRTKNLSVPANRCYVDLNEPHPAMAPKAGVRRISFGATGMNVTTGIENGGLINGENGAQKVLIDGQLFILRGEKMYDATGRLVK